MISEEWYHGLMPRDDIEELIKNPGDFIVRKTEVSLLNTMWKLLEFTNFDSDIVEFMNLSNRIK